MKNPSLAVLLTCFTIAALPALAQDSDDQKADLRLALDKVSLYAETQRLKEAYALLDQLKQEYPNNSQVLQAEADLNLRVGNRGAAFAALSKAITLDPANENILERQRAAMLAQGSFVAGSYRYRSTDLANEHFGRFTGQAALSSTISFGIDIENDHLNSKGLIIRPNGSSQKFDDDRQRGTFTLGKMYSNGNEASISAYANNHTPGVGGQFSWWGQQGATTVQANLRKPDWDYVETVIENGTRDNVRLERKQILTSHLQATLGGGFNHYVLEGDSDAASAGAWDFNLAYTHPYSFFNNPDDEVMLGAYYTVDAEYFTSIDKRHLGAATYKPLPASSYEIHSVNVSASKNITSDVYGEAYGGYGIDRLGSNGPLFGAALEYAPIEHLGIELRGSRTMLGGERNTQKEDQLGLNLKWRW